MSEQLRTYCPCCGEPATASRHDSISGSLSCGRCDARWYTEWPADREQQPVRVVVAQQGHAPYDRPHTPLPRSPFNALTNREREVMDLVVAGKPNKQTAQILGITESTVEKHRSKVMKKLRANSLPDLVRIYVMEMAQADQRTPVRS